jgi:hypothetical protein
MSSVVGHEEIELRDKEQHSLTQPQQPEAIGVENVNIQPQVQQKTHLTVTQPQVQESPADTNEPEEEEVEVARFKKFRDRVTNLAKSFYINLRFFVHHKNKVDKRNYYCGYTCHGWGTMIVFYLFFYAFLTGFFVGLYFLAYYIMYVYFNVYLHCLGLSLNKLLFGQHPHLLLQYFRLPQIRLRMKSCKQETILGM